MEIYQSKPKSTARFRKTNEFLISGQKNNRKFFRLKIQFKKRKQLTTLLIKILKGWFCNFLKNFVSRREMKILLMNTAESHSKSSLYLPKYLLKKKYY